jgi:hypothetical protein
MISSFPISTVSVEQQQSANFAPCTPRIRGKWIEWEDREDENMHMSMRNAIDISKRHRCIVDIKILVQLIPNTRNQGIIEWIWVDSGDMIDGMSGSEKSEESCDTLTVRGAR